MAERPTVRELYLAKLVTRPVVASAAFAGYSMFTPGFAVLGTSCIAA